MKATYPRWRPVRLTIMLSGVFFLYACQPDILTPVGPESEEDFSKMGGSTPQTAQVWYEVASALVEPGQKIKIKGSRYTLRFDGDEIVDPQTITIRERHHDVVDVDLGPHGLLLMAPVTLEVNYAGTSNDPSSSKYGGKPPTVYKRELSSWKPVPGVARAGNSPIRVLELMSFSRFAMGDGTGGIQIGNPSKKRGRPGDHVRTP